jgi:hypothetical protein
MASLVTRVDVDVDSQHFCTPQSSNNLSLEQVITLVPCAFISAVDLAHVFHIYIHWSRTLGPLLWLLVLSMKSIFSSRFELPP